MTDHPSRIERLLSRANIHGVTPRDIPGSALAALRPEDVYAAMGVGRLSRPAGELGLAVYMHDPLAMIFACTQGAAAIRDLFEREGWPFDKPYRNQVNDDIRAGLLTREQGEARKVALAQRLPATLAQVALNDVMQGGRCSTCKGIGSLIEAQKRGQLGDRGLCRHCGGAGATWEQGIDQRLGYIARQFGDMDIPAYKQFELNCTHCHGAGSVPTRSVCSACHGQGTLTPKSQRHIAAVCQIKETTWCQTWQPRYRRILLIYYGWLTEFEDHLRQRC